jgi:alcohol dehydrogenase class IV
MRRGHGRGIEKAKPEAVVALGGGSVLDAAKAAYLSWQSGLHVAELFGQGKASAKFPGRKFKTVICMPTTAGTGSEATPYANIVDRKLDVKMLIVEKAIIPELAFVDPSFTLSMGEKLTMTTALDALAHAVEGFLNVKAKDAHPDSQAWAVEAIELIVKNLPVALKRPDDYAARESLAAAATLGGMVIRQRPTSLPHLCSFSFFDKVPHGVVVAALLPHFWRFYLKEEAVRERTMLLKGIFPGPAQDAPEAVVDAAEAFIRSCGAPKSLGELPGCDDALIAKIAAAAKKNPSKLESAPRPLGVDDAETLIAEVLRKAFAR